MSEFLARRKRLMTELTDGAIVVPAGHMSKRNSDVDYEFRQQSPFWYLTGFDEPEAVAVLRPGHDQPFALFVQARDPKMETWNGLRAGVDGVKEKRGADEAWTVGELEKELPKLLADYETVYYALGTDQKLDRLLTELTVQRRRLAQRGDKRIAGIIDPLPAIDVMRLVKSEYELTCLQTAVDVTVAGFSAGMKATRPGAFEYEVQAEMEVQFRRGGSPRNGYASIVASGANACILHYISNRGRIADGDLVLVDAGAEHEFYSADITRTWPAGGKFSPEQRDVYEIVLAANEAGIAAARPGAGIDDVHQAALRVLSQGLVDLGALEGELDGLIEKREYLPYYMHGTSHWLGLDVHDAGVTRTGGRTGPSTLLEAGMVLTVEPGLYFGPFADKAPDALKGIGVRIEDDVAITGQGNRVMTASVPKGIAEVEAAAGDGFDA